MNTSRAPPEPRFSTIVECGGDEEIKARIKEMDRRATEHQIAAFGKFAKEAKAKTPKA
jgi:hypothetical protein